MWAGTADGVLYSVVSFKTGSTADRIHSHIGACTLNGGQEVATDNLPYKVVVLPRYIDTS